MPKETLDKLSQRIHENTKFYGCEIRLKTKIKNKPRDMSIDEIEFRNSHPNEIDELIKFLKLEMERKELENIFRITYSNEIALSLNYDFLKCIKGDTDSINKKCKECGADFDKKVIQKIFEKINECNKKNILESDSKVREQMIFIKCLLEHHYVYVSLICDHIAGMTDNYANNEYKKLYLV